MHSRTAHCLIRAMWLTALVLTCASCSKEEKPANDSIPLTDATASKETPAPHAATQSAAPAQEIPPATAEDLPPDDPNTPAYFPINEEVPGWGKVEPVRRATPGKYEQLVDADDDLLRLTDTFRTRAMMACAYEYGKGSDNVRADILIVETLMPEDAYGLLSVMSNAAASSNIGSMTRIDTENGLTYHTWQGGTYVRMRVTGIDTPADAEPAESLLVSITNQIPSSEPPEILQWVSLLNRPMVHQWLGRQMASFRTPATSAMPLYDPPEIDDVLGTSQETLVAVFAFEVPDDEPPNFVWVVQYPNRQEAKAAYDRYGTLLEELAASSPVNTLLAEPVGRYLVGTWTADQESVDPVISLITASLPGN